MYQGVVPHPDHVAHWQNLVPNAPERFLRMAEKQQEILEYEIRSHHTRKDTVVSSQHIEGMADIKGANVGRWISLAVFLVTVGLVGWARYFML